RIRRYAAAHKTRLPQDEPPVALIAQTDGFAQSTGRPASRSLFGLRRRFMTSEVLVGDSKRRRVRGQTIGRTGRRRPVPGLAIAGRGGPIPEPPLDRFGIRRCQGVLGRQISLRPAGCSSAEPIAASWLSRRSRRIADCSDVRTGAPPSRARAATAVSPVDWL